MLAPTPLLSLYREGHEEVCVYGEVALWAGGGEPFRSGDAGSRCAARSLLKPFQLVATGLAERALGPRHTPALGSISATAQQVAQLERWYPGPALADLSARLALPPALPLCELARARLLASGGAPSPLYHPCFSKHVAILAACAEQGWPEAGYTEREHPYHAALCRLLAELLGRELAQHELVGDGCGLPTPLLAPLELASLYHALASAPAATALGRACQAMLREPEWIGGPERWDTRLMQANPGLLLAKEGADGLLALGIVPSARAPGGAGVLIKLAGGHQPALAALVATPFLEHFGLASLEVPTPGQSVVWHVRPGRERAAALDISPALSERIAVWPGDTPFTRRPVSEPGASTDGPGWELLVSSIHTTLHVGAHADAPNHFQVGAAGIDAVPLAPYRGRCQVLAVEVPKGGTIGIADLGAQPPRAPRLLFKTGSFPDPERFDSDFVAFAPELIEWLAAQGVLLVGIDTPSVDPFSSKSLPSHHMTRTGRALSILEGLVLDRVEPGLYELVALPLRIEGADASPVRAVLWPLR